MAEHKRPRLEKKPTFVGTFSGKDIKTAVDKTAEAHEVMKNVDKKSLRYEMWAKAQDPKHPNYPHRQFFVNGDKSSFPPYLLGLFIIAAAIFYFSGSDKTADNKTQALRDAKLEKSIQAAKKAGIKQ